MGEARSWKVTTLAILNWLWDQWLIFGLGLAILLAYLFPSVGKTGGHIRAEYSVKYACIGVIFFITGITLSTRALINQARNWKLHLVAQVLSFFVFSAIIYAIVAIILASNTRKIDIGILSGLVTMSVLPTTIASNVAMTRNSGGNVEAATIEVCIGNVVGTFITPLLLTMYLRPLADKGFVQPDSKGGSGLVGIYSHMGKQLGISLFAPLIVGQVLQNVYPEKTKAIATRLKVNIIGQILILVLIWSTFSNCFATGVFKYVSNESIIMVCFLNIGLYALMSAICLLVARLPFLGEPEEDEFIGKRLLRKAKFDKKVTAAICFCSAAKGLVLGAPLISILYSAYDERTQSILTVPIALYQGSQIALAQLAVRGVKNWIQKDEGDKEKTVVEDQKLDSSDGSERGSREDQKGSDAKV